MAFLGRFLPPSNDSEREDRELTRYIIVRSKMLISNSDIDAFNYVFEDVFGIKRLGEHLFYYHSPSQIKRFFEECGLSSTFFCEIYSNPYIVKGLTQLNRLRARRNVVKRLKKKKISKKRKKQFKEEEGYIKDYYSKIKKEVLRYIGASSLDTISPEETDIVKASERFLNLAADFGFMGDLAYGSLKTSDVSSERAPSYSNSTNEIKTQKKKRAIKKNILDDDIPLSASLDTENNEMEELKTQVSLLSDAVYKILDKMAEGETEMSEPEIVDTVPDAVNVIDNTDTKHISEESHDSESTSSV